MNDPDLQELLEVVTLDAKRMNQIISNILTLATIDVLTPEALIGKSQVADIISRVVSAEHHFTSQNNLRVNNLVSPSFVIRMNDSHCDLLYSNLISNAVKYSRMNGVITLSAEIGGDTFCLNVTDDGVGIEPENLTRIFEEFYKTDSSRHDRDSHGLGLSLVQRIVKSYGGSVKAGSGGLDKGTTIHVYFPVRMVIDYPSA